MAMTAKFDGMPTGIVDATLNGPRLSAPFTMKAIFTTPDSNCAKGMYRQYVKGFFQSNNSVVPHVLCKSTSVMLSKTDFHEDGCDIDGTAYGYRTKTSTASKYLPNNATGCTFEGSDQPGISGKPGDRLIMDLHFEAKLFDMTDGKGTLLASTSWQVKGDKTVPKVATHQSEARMMTRDGESIYVKVWRDTAEDDWSGMLVAAHSGEHDAANGLSYADGGIDIHLAVWGDAGQGDVQELEVMRGDGPMTVGGSLARTSTTYFRIARSGTPQQMTGSFNGKPFNLRLSPPGN